LDEIKNQKDRLDPDNKNQDIEAPDLPYVEKFVDTAAYDSIVSSGLFTHLETDTQNNLSNLYNKFKCRNESIIKLENLIDIAISHKHYPNKE
jgi:hypothetical protein